MLLGLAGARGGRGKKSKEKGKKARGIGSRKKDSNNGVGRPICQLANAFVFTGAEPTVKRSSVGPVAVGADTVCTVERSSVGQQCGEGSPRGQQFYSDRWCGGSYPRDYNIQGASSLSRVFFWRRGDRRQNVSQLADFCVNAPSEECRTPQHWRNLVCPGSCHFVNKLDCF